MMGVMVLEGLNGLFKPLLMLVASIWYWPEVLMEILARNLVPDSSTGSS